MKNPKSKKQKDPSVPYDIFFKVKKDDCFGTGWDLTDHVCKNECSVFESCGVVFNQVTKKKVAKLEKQMGGFVDQWNFDVIDKPKLAKKVKKGKYTMDKLLKYFEDKSKCNDKYTLVCQVTDFLSEYKITL